MSNENFSFNHWQLMIRHKLSKYQFYQKLSNILRFWKKIIVWALSLIWFVGGLKFSLLFLLYLMIIYLICYWIMLQISAEYKIYFDFWSCNINILSSLMTKRICQYFALNFQGKEFQFLKCLFIILSDFNGTNIELKVFAQSNFQPC